MQFAKLFWIAFKAIAVLGFFPLVFFSYVIIATHHAKSQAETICLSVPIGSSVDAAKNATLTAETEPRLRYVSPEFIGVGFRGVFAERYFCDVKIAQGKVVAYEIRLVD